MTCGGRYSVARLVMRKLCPTSLDKPRGARWIVVMEYRRKADAIACAEREETRAVVSDKATNLQVIHDNRRPPMLEYDTGLIAPAATV